MKTKAYTLIALLLIAGARLAPAADALSDTLQKGLFEEEANHNLDAAIKAYQDVIARHDDQRKLAATAIFRLGECYRKLGRTNDAVAQYQRLVGDFSEQNMLVNLSRQNLVGLGVAAPGFAESGANGSLTERLKTITDAAATNQEAEEVRRIKTLIKDSPDLINAQQGGLTPLHEAARKGQLVVAGFLLANKADIEANANGTGFVGKTPLILAAENGHKSMVELLLSKGADANASRSSGTALHAAARKGFRSVAETLIASNAAVNASGGSGFTPLHEAVSQKFSSMAELLIARGADVNVQGGPLPQDGETSFGGVTLPRLHGTPLHYAANAGNQAMVDLLMKSKADPNLKNEANHTPLHYAAAVNADSATVAALIQGGAEVNAPVTTGKNPGWTPLHYAVANGRKGKVELLLKNKANPDLAIETGFGGSNFKGQTALTMAVLLQNKDLTELLLNHGANPNSLDERGLSSLNWATSIPSAELVELLLKFKANPDARGGRKGSAPLFSAVFRRETAIMELLLRHKADPNVRDENDGTPLHRLVQGTLLSQGSTSSFAQRIERTAVSADRTVVAMAQLLLTNKADVNLRNAQGLTPLNLMGIPANPQNQTQKELADLLRQHGASDEVADLQPNPSVIRAWRRGLGDGPVIFTKDTKGLNRFTLMEALTSFYQHRYGQSWRPRNDGTDDKRFDFPNLVGLTIKRLMDGKTYRDIKVNLLNATNGVDCAQDVVLEFGDVIEIPERDHSLGEQAQGLSVEHWNQLRECPKRKVTLIVKGQPNELASLVGIWRYLSYALQTGNALQVLASSSDLSRVTVKRPDPKGGSPAQEFTRDVTAFRATNQPLSEDLLLEDGDVIEVPDK